MTIFQYAGGEYRYTLEHYSLTPRCMVGMVINDDKICLFKYSIRDHQVMIFLHADIMRTEW